MRVLHVYGGALFGGIESMLATMARRQASCPALVHEFALSGDGPLARAIAASGGTVHRLPQARASRPVSVWRARRALSHLMTLRAFDRVICHAAWPYALFGGVAANGGVPLVAWAHDAATGRHWTERWAARTVPDLTICNSQYTAGTVARVWPTAARTVLYCPSDLASADDERSSGDRAAVRTAVRAELATPMAATVIVQAGRLEPYKGHALLLSALGSLVDSPDWILWVVGGAERPHEREHLESLRHTAERLGIASRVRFTGHRADIGRVLHAADLHCQPNIAPEPFGLAFIDALSMGLPVIGSRSGGVEEIVDASCGVLVSPGDTEALTSALRRLVHDPAARRRLGAAGPARARRLCDPATQLAALHHVLSLMPGRRDAA
jgi:glycosyltransferase involved in cell wall biosynthesis